MVIGMKKGKAVDSYFQAIGDRNVMMLYGNGRFPPPPENEDSVPTGSQKAFPDRSAGEHRASRGCPFCQKSDLVPVTAEGRVQENKRSLDWRRCTACNLGREAGHDVGTSRRLMQKDKLAARNTRRCGIAELKGKKRPCDLQKAKCSL